MSERINIFGGKNCLLPGGKPCLACCQTYRVPELPKPAEKLCAHAKSGLGCDIYRKPLMPKRCADYFCTDRPISEQMQVMGAAFSLGQINTQEAVKLGEKLAKSASPKK